MCDVLGFEIDRNGVIGKYLGSALPRDSFLCALSIKYKAIHHMREPVYLSNGSLSQFYFLHSIQPRLYSLRIQHKSFI